MEEVKHKSWYLLYMEWVEEDCQCEKCQKKRKERELLDNK